MSADLVWSVVRRNNAFTLNKKSGGAGKGSKQIWSTEQGNLSNKHSFKASGLANHRAISVTAGADGKGVAFSSKSKKNAFKPAKQFTNTVQLTRGARPTVNAIKGLVRHPVYAVSPPHHSLPYVVWSKSLLTNSAYGNICLFQTAGRFFRADLTQTAVARATKILASQKTVTRKVGATCFNEHCSCHF